MGWEPEIPLLYFLSILLIPVSSIYVMHHIFLIEAQKDDFSNHAGFCGFQDRGFHVLLPAGYKAPVAAHTVGFVHAVPAVIRHHKPLHQG